MMASKVTMFSISFLCKFKWLFMNLNGVLLINNDSLWFSLNKIQSFDTLILN